MRRTLAILGLAAFLSVGLTPRVATAGSVVGGSLSPQGEKSHNVGGGWPDFFYVWEGLARDKVALGPRFSLQVYPFAWSAGLNVRLTVLEKGQVALALLVVPSFNMAGFGGSRGQYTTYVGGSPLGTSRTFRPSMGPGVNVGLLATIDVPKEPRLHVNVTFENPFAVWVWVDPPQWWLEWPMTFSGGVEYDVSESTSIFGRLGGGPAVAFAGSNLLLGFHWHAYFGAQFRIAPKDY